MDCLDGKKWKDVVGYEGLYSVSDCGDVRNIIKNRIIKRSIQNHHYSVWLSKNGIGRHIKVHTIVLETFGSKRKDGYECCHNDGNPLNNRIDNLMWGTHTENMRDKIIHGTNISAYGENHGRSKLKSNNIAEIRSLLSSMSLRKIAKKFNVCHKTIINIKNNKIWVGV